MPFLKYCAYVGGVLLTLLLLANWYLPTPDAERERADADRSIIRIHSAHKWPTAVVFDTTQPTIVPPAAVTAAQAALPEPASAPAKPAREAYALAVAEPPAAKPAEVAKPVKRHVRRARATRPPPSYGYVASYDPFGFRSGWASNW